MFTQLFLRMGSGVILISSLFGCSVYPDKNEDPSKNNQSTFQRDAIDCARSYPEVGSGTHVKERVSCMNLKGWH